MRVPRYPTKKRPTQRYNRVAAAFFAGDVPAAEDMQQPKPRGAQPEGETNKAIAKWRNYVPGLVLERNKRRLATPPGMTQPILLGWLAPGSPDWIGYLPVRITPEHVGKTIAVFVGIEAKRPDAVPVVSDEQQAFLDAARDAGAIVGVARNAEEAQLAIERWHKR